MLLVVRLNRGNLCEGENMQAYSDPTRENDPHALPDVEVFYQDVSDPDCVGNGDQEDGPLATGWYWWPCFPGCLPDSDPIGPFDSEDEALADAQSEHED